MNKKRLKIEWNTFTRCLINKADNNLFYSKLLRYHVWPIEIFISNKGNQHKSAKSEKKSKSVATSGTTVNFEHFIGFLNISALLYPGGN
ncbi:hypothetical protein Phum_PHUM348120 [Pediculus humanus corporis]|uniref:Uncharacterized protein n=1 Tax=Pediculus humanus subsp. corporis TaxID=121224 RepID=E0VNZ5_PEDHC|nr:uncharacterized protein Phum_PHUM348120 [Pediculus humanus corporis]EEB15101.1 hypothetical protein Phum_PHUM348120 [Pediculus humanus corporis]